MKAGCEVSTGFGEFVVVDVVVRTHDNRRYLLRWRVESLFASGWIGGG